MKLLRLGHALTLVVPQGSAYREFADNISGGGIAACALGKRIACTESGEKGKKDFHVTL